MKPLIIVCACLLSLPAFAQNVGIGTSEPISKLSIDSGLNVDQANVNGSALESALTFGNDKRTGIGSRRIAGSNQYGLDFYTHGLRRVTIDTLGNLGIGSSSSPLYRLLVSGNSYLSGNLYQMGNLGIGTSAPAYSFVNMLGYNHLYYGLGIGTVPTSTYKLDVDGGPVRFRQDTRIDGVLNPNNALNIGNNTTIEGKLLVNGNKGIVRSNNSTQVKMVRTAVTLGAGIGAGSFVDSGDFFYETFGDIPQVFVGNMVTASNSEWASLEFIPFAVDTNSCRFRVFNHGSAAVNVQVTYSVMIVGAE